MREDVNQVIVRGNVSGQARLTDLPAGTAMRFYVVADGRTVPVFWDDHYGQLLHDGERVEVHGAIRTRYFRAGGTTHSRTELVARSVIRE